MHYIVAWLNDFKKRRRSHSGSPKCQNESGEPSFNHLLHTTHLSPSGSRLGPTSVPFLTRIARPSLRSVPIGIDIVRDFYCYYLLQANANACRFYSRIITLSENPFWGPQLFKHMPLLNVSKTICGQVYMHAVLTG